MTHVLWHADITLTEDQTKQCIESQFPSLSIQSIRCIGEGWDNTVFLVNESLIFRFPRRNISIELIERENRLLPNLQSLLNLGIPNPHYYGQPTEAYPYPFQGYPMLQGTSGCHAQLSDEERIASLAPLSLFLKRLHAIDEQQALVLGAELQVFDRTDREKTINTLRERIAKIVALELFDINQDELELEIKAGQAVALPSEKCLIHGDLYCRHLLFQDGKLKSVIDWGDAGINNKAVDLSVIWSFYPVSCHTAFFEWYGAVDADTWQYARFLALYGDFILILYGHDIGDKLLVQEAVESVKRINDRILFNRFGAERA